MCFSQQQISHWLQEPWICKHPWIFAELLLLPLQQIPRLLTLQGGYRLLVAFRGIFRHLFHCFIRRDFFYCIFKLSDGLSVYFSCSSDVLELKLTLYKEKNPLFWIKWKYMCVVHRSYWKANREWLWSPLVEGVVTFGWLVGWLCTTLLVYF